MIMEYLIAQWVGGGGYSPKFYTGSLHPEVHTLYETFYDRKGTCIVNLSSTDR